MKFTHILAVILGVSTGSSACHAQFRNTKWGDSIEAVFKAEQIENFQRIDSIRIVPTRPVNIGNERASCAYDFAAGKLFRASYHIMTDYRPTWFENVETALAHYSHFYSLLEMKYGAANAEEVPGEFEALLNPELPLSPQQLQDLIGLWTTEKKLWWSTLSSVFALEVKSTWESDGTKIELHFDIMSDNEEITFSDIDTDTPLGVGVYIVYKDSQNWARSLERQREEWDSNRKRKAQEKREALLKGL